jgi:hypothetical protein
MKGSFLYLHSEQLIAAGEAPKNGLVKQNIQSAQAFVEWKAVEDDGKEEGLRIVMMPSKKIQLSIKSASDE